MGFFDSIKQLSPSRVKDRLANFIVNTGARYGFATGLSRDETIDQFRDSGWGRLATPLATVWDNIQQTADNFGYYSRLGLDELPDSNRFRDATFITDRFGYVVEHDIYDRQGNLMGSQTSRIDTSDRLTQENLLGLLQENYLTSSGIRFHDMSNLRILGALKNPNITE